MKTWEQRKLKDYLEVSREKNKTESYGKEDVLSVSGEHGIVNQIEFQGRSFAGVSVANYGVVEAGDVVYTKSPLKSNPYGIIKTNKGKTGIVSTLYAVYKPRMNTNSEFVQIYFELDSRMNSYMHPLVNKGAKNDMKVSDENALKGPVAFPELEEQNAITQYFDKLDRLITLHQRKCYRFIDIALDAWEQRKWIDVVDISTEMVNPTTGEYDNMPHIAPGNIESFTGRILDNVKTVKEEQLISGKFRFRPDDVVYGKINPQLGKYFYATVNGLTSADAYVFNGKNGLKQKFLFALLQTSDFFKYSVSVSKRSGMPKINRDELNAYSFLMPSEEEQDRIGSYLLQLDHLITLHQHKLFCAKNVMKYITTDINTPKKEAIMAELESVIEQKLIEQLIYGDSQWTYREDLKTEADLWKNFRYILEQNNKERLNGEPLSDAEFEQVKNQLQFSSFYKAGEWLVGENGKVMVHVQRDTERLHLVVMNHEHIAGGSSVYEVINQYNALKMDEDSSVNARDRRFDVTLMINGLPMIHIELKNKQHSYMDGF